MSFTDYLESNLMNLVFRNVAWTPPTTVYLALFTTATADSGVAGTEVAGGSYARQPVAFATTATIGLLVSSADVEFLNMPAANVTHGALMTALTGGSQMAQGPLAVAQLLASGNAIRFLAGQVQVQLS